VIGTRQFAAGAPLGEDKGKDEREHSNQMGAGECRELARVGVEQRLGSPIRSSF
jgi:hypothetical protein